MSAHEKDLEYMRHRMVKEQLEGRDIKDKKVLDVFQKVARHRFIDPRFYKDAYSDFPLPIDNGQTISQPYIVALMVQLLEINQNDKVLEIGTGSGYETAILAELASRVYSIERIDILAEKAARVLDELGYKNIMIKTGDGTTGWNDFKPFDKIIVTASGKDVPGPLLDQLKAPGKLAMPVGSKFSQTLLLVEKNSKGDILEKGICGCTFVPLIGRYGWEESNETKTI